MRSFCLMAFVLGQPAGDQVEHRAPAGAVRPDHAERLAFLQAQAEPVGDRQGAIAIGFTTAYDRVVVPEDLCGADELAALRARLDAETGELRSLLARLAAQLQRRLMARQRRRWDFDLEDGELDCCRLDRVVTRPASPLAFRQERQGAFLDTVAALLIDRSGSMRGRPILLAAIAADVAARAGTLRRRL
jgi:cobaltochelatase CobT